MGAPPDGGRRRVPVLVPCAGLLGHRPVLTQGTFSRLSLLPPPLTAPALAGPACWALPGSLRRGTWNRRCCRPSPARPGRVSSAGGCGAAAAAAMRGPCTTARRARSARARVPTATAWRLREARADTGPQARR